MKVKGRCNDGIFAKADDEYRTGSDADADEHADAEHGLPDLGSDAEHGLSDLRPDDETAASRTRIGQFCKYACGRALLSERSRLFFDGSHPGTVHPACHY
jgi:hypothetical protein